MMTASPDARKRKPQSRKRKAQEVVPVNPEGTRRRSTLARICTIGLVSVRMNCMSSEGTVMDVPSRIGSMLNGKF
jgi:hypothetical protein